MPLASVLSSFLNSEKGVYALALAIGSTVLALLGHSSYAEWREFNLYVFGIYVGGKSIQGAATAIASRPSKSPANVQNTTVVATEERRPEGGSVRLCMAGMIALAMCSLVAVAACRTLKGEGKAIAGNVVDCAAKEAVKLSRQLEPMVDQLFQRARGQDGKIDWPSVELATEKLEPLAWCAAENTVARWLKKSTDAVTDVQSSELVADKANLDYGFAELREKRFPGVKFKGTP
jgi:hypothetical protein